MEPTAPLNDAKLVGHFFYPHMKTQYQKEPTSVSEQIDLLESKGMDISDRANAYHILSIIGYYRFSGYAYPFRNESDNSSFVEGTSFDKVYGIYEFDRSLKALLFSYLARIEVAFRTLIINKFSLGTKSALWYIDSEYFTDKEEHQNFILRLENDLDETREVFIQHFRDTYSDKFPPSWIALQTVSFGTLIKLYRNFNNHELSLQVAKQFGCDNVDRFVSWMNTMVYLRNICSHHSRLWNRPIKKRPAAFNFGIRTKRWSNTDVSKLYYSICVIGYLLKNLYPGNLLKCELASLFSSNQYVDSTKGKYLGFPNNWQTEFAWE